MKTAFCFLLLFFSVNLIAQATDDKHHGQNGADDCLQATSDKDGMGVHVFPGSSKKLYSYNVDIKPGPDHKAICVSHSHLDSVLWHHGDGTGCFKIEPKLVSKLNAEGNACPAYPFTRELPNSCVHMHHSEHAKKDAIGCSYDMVFHREDGSSADPHIVIGK